MDKVRIGMMGFGRVGRQIFRLIQQDDRFEVTAVSDIGQPQMHASVSSDPVAQGEALFRSSPPACNACHSVAPGVNLAGPTLAGLGARAAAIIASSEYQGSAKTPAEYIRESITHPSAYLVPGAMYSANNQSFMPDNFVTDLEPAQIDSLVAYLETLK